MILNKKIAFEPPHLIRFCQRRSRDLWLRYVYGQANMYLRCDAGHEYE